VLNWDLSTPTLEQARKTPRVLSDSIQYLHKEVLDTNVQKRKAKIDNKCPTISQKVFERSGGLSPGLRKAKEHDDQASFFHST
jgi:hypothetical protein